MCLKEFIIPEAASFLKPLEFAKTQDAWGRKLRQLQ